MADDDVDPISEPETPIVDEDYLNMEFPQVGPDPPGMLKVSDTPSEDSYDRWHPNWPHDTGRMAMAIQSFPLFSIRSNYTPPPAKNY